MSLASPSVVVSPELCEGITSEVMPASHGAKRVHRSGGSIGQSADPSRVLAGTKMPGRYGGVRVTSRNLRLVRVDNESNVLLVRGAVPGPTGSFVVVRRSAKNRV
jgi:large subunit ribosomal protein L3